MKKMWLIGLGVVALAILGFFLLSGESGLKTTTTTSETTSNETNGLLGSISGIWGGIGNIFGGGGDDKPTGN